MGMGLSSTTEHRIAKGEINFVTSKDGKGSSILGQVALEKGMGVQLNPILVGENDKWNKGDPRMAIGLGDANGKSDNRIYMNGDKNQSLFMKACNATGQPVDMQWNSVSRALEGRENLDLSHIQGVNILDAYSRCTTRDEKLELMRTLYNNPNFNPRSDAVPTEQLSPALKDKIENNTNKVFYDKEVNHIKSMNISGEKIGIVVSNDANIGKEVKGVSLNNIIINPSNDRIIINTDGKVMNPTSVLGAIGRTIEGRGFGDISIRGSQIVLKTDDLNTSPFTRDTIVDICRNAIESKNAVASTIDVKGEQLTINPIEQMVYDKLESIYGKVSNWDSNIIEAYVKVVDALTQSNFDTNVEQVVKIDGFGEIIPVVDSNNTVAIQIKLEDEYKIGNRSFEVIDVGEVNVVTTYNDVAEIPANIIEALNALPDYIKDSVDAIVIVRAEEMNNPAIQERIEGLRKEINFGGELAGQRIMVVNETADKMIPSILNATDKIIGKEFGGIVEGVFKSNANDTDTFKSPIKEFVNEIKLAFTNNYLNELDVTPSKEAIATASFHEAINTFLEKTIEVKLSDVAADNSTNPKFDQVQDTYNALVNKIEQIKDLDLEHEGHGLDLDVLKEVIERVGRVDSELEDLRLKL